VPNANQANLKFIEPADEVLLNRIYTLDLFFINVDRTENSNNFLKDEKDKIWIIDHGALGLFQAIDIRRKDLFSNHIFNKILRKKEFIYDPIIQDTQLFSEIIDLIPHSIITEAGFTKKTLLNRIKARINYLS
jgi:hypothetical protein